MNDKIPNMIHRYTIYALIIFGVALFFALLTKFFWAIATTRHYFGI